MASLNVGAMAARLGLEPGEFLEKMKGVQGFNTAVSAQMAKQWAQTSREGAESLHLLDHALGIVLPRSLNRLLTREFPAFGAAMQSILGAGVVGVLGEAGLQFGEKLAAKIEKARKVMDDLRLASEKVKTVAADVAESWDEKIGKLRWNKEQLLFSEGAQVARKQVEELGKALDDLQKKQIAASGFWTRTLAGIGEEWHRVFTSDRTKLAEQGVEEFNKLRASIERAFAIDQVQGTDNALKAINNDILSIQEKMEAGPFLSSFAADLPNLQKQLDYLNQVKTAIEEQRDAWQRAKAAAEAHAEAIERQKHLAAELQKFPNDLAAGWGKMHPQEDPFERLRTEVSGLRMAAENDFKSIAEYGASALDLRLARAQLSYYESDLDRVLIKHRQDAELAKATAGLPATIPLTAFGAAPNFAPSAEKPVLGSGGLPGAQLDAFAKDRAAQLALIAKAQEAALPGLEKYATDWAKLDLAFKDRTDADSIATKQAAQNALIEQYAASTLKAANATHKLQDEMQKLLERSTDAGAGLQAFLIQLQIDASENAKFVFDALTSASKGLEDTATSSIIAIIESHKNQHMKLIHELRAMWESYFASLAQMALKHGMDKILAGGLAKLGGAGGGAANTSALTANTHALMVLAAKMGAGVGLPFPIPGVGGGGASAGAASAGGGLEMFAAGGDVTPGGSFISGEAGAERVDLSREGGAHVTPLGFKMAGGDTHHHYNDFRGAVVTEELLKKADAAQMMEHSEGRAVARAVSMGQEIGRRGRPPR